MGDQERSVEFLMAPVRVFVVDAAQLVGVAISALLEGFPGLSVVGCAADAERAVAAILADMPDVVLVDIAMPGQDPLGAISYLSKSVPDTRILVLTTVRTPELVLATVRAGAAGYLTKDISPEELVAAICNVHRGDPVFASFAMQSLIDGLLFPESTKDPCAALTPRERDVLGLLVGGLTNEQIASELGISERTVSVHMTRVLEKLGVENRTQAALYASRAGLVWPVPEPVVTQR